MSFVPPSAEIPRSERPTTERFTLPDQTAIQYTSDSPDTILISLGVEAANPKAELKSFVRFAKTQRSTRVSQHGLVNDDRAKSEAVWKLEAEQGVDGQKISYEDLWGAIYAFWIRNDDRLGERLPVELGESLDRGRLLQYIVHAGLGFRAPDAVGEFEVLLDRSAFWQGAGAPHSRNWLRQPRPPVDVPFPNILSFTRGPNTLTTHPLRPPKPAPGTLLYSRYIHAVKSHLTLVHIDASNASHFEAYTRWQNSDRVNVGWREKGDEKHHRDYIAMKLAQPHAMGFLVAWDGELAGYGEASWNKEDGMAAFVGGMGDFDQGTHLLVGEERFRGRHRFAAIMTSMKHFCFLREPRTNIVIGEPRSDLPIISLLKHYLPQDYRKEVELPHKRAVFFVLHRDRFHSDAIWY